jgi:hypothetical protein
MGPEESASASAAAGKKSLLLFFELQGKSVAPCLQISACEATGHIVFVKWAAATNQILCR